MSQTVYTDTNILNEDTDLSSSVTNDFVKKTYDFSEFTFTNCGATGYLGPTYNQMANSYSSTLWTKNILNLDMINRGIQLWNVPTSGYYRIIIGGARGGNGVTGSIGGSGVVVSTIVYLFANEVIKILVGQLGSLRPLQANGWGGGGGGTFVMRSSSNTPILIAGGGGGGGNSSLGNGLDATINTNGTNGGGGASCPGGTLGNGAPNTSGGGGGGGGLFSDAGGAGGKGFIKGGEGLNAEVWYQNGAGGFGGGGVGGGGYSGGGGVQSGGQLGGGGGGSYDINGPGNVATLYTGPLPSSVPSAINGYNLVNGFVFISSGLPILSFPYVRTGLVGYWDMATYVTGTASWSGTGTNIMDKSDSGNNLTLTVGNNGTYTSGTTPYISIGTTTYAEKPVTLNLNSTGLTFECLVQITNTNNFAPIMYYNIPSTAAGMRLSTLPATAPLVGLGTWNRIGNYALDNTLSQNTWYHIVVTIEGGQLAGSPGVERWYINGSFVSSSSRNNGSGILPASVTYNLGFGTDRESGRTGVTTNFAMGRVYNRVLSAADVTQNYSSIRANGNPYGITAPSIEYPTSPLTNDSSLSSSVASNPLLFNGFDKNNNTFLNLNSSNYSIVSPFSYNGSVSTTVSSVVILGDWISILLPYGIILTSYSLTARNDAAFGQIPRTWTIAGSIDGGSTWSFIDSRTSITWSQGETKVFTTDTNNTMYTRYRIIIQAASQFPSICEWRLFSTFSIG